jgi:hypothetical protein
MRDARTVAMGSRRTLYAFILAMLLGILMAECRRTDKPASSEPAQEPQSDEVAGTASVPDASIRPVYPRDPGPPDPVAQRLCDALHTLPQKRKSECCGTPPLSSLATECVRLLTAALRDGAVTLNAQDVDRCVEEASRALEGCDWVTPLMPTTPAACRGIVVGQLEAGARCRSSLDCKDGLFCRGASPTTVGVCAVPGAAGATCGGPTDTLATYLGQVDYETRHPECDGFCRGGQCTEYIAVGGACSSDKQCAPGTHCASGRCVDGPLPTIGEACSGSACADDAVCVGGKCVALKAAGEPCTSPFECRAVCLIRPGAKFGTCGPKCSNWPPAGYLGWR